MYAPEPAPSRDPTLTDQIREAIDDARTGQADSIDAVEVFNPEGQAPILIISDHSGCKMPACLNDLGLSEAERHRHIGWDIGVTDMTRRLAEQLDAIAVLNHVSRLVIDPNRKPYMPTSIPAVADGPFVPGNQDLSPAEQHQRIRLSFIPCHRKISGQITRLRRRVGVPVVICMHSFTPAMQKEWRPWKAGVPFGEDNRLATPVLEGLRKIARCVSAPISLIPATIQTAFPFNFTHFGRDFRMSLSGSVRT